MVGVMCCYGYWRSLEYVQGNMSGGCVVFIRETVHNI